MIHDAEQAVGVGRQVDSSNGRFFIDEMVDKTGVLMACIPGDGELDLKQLAAVSGNKKVEMVHLKEVLALTGYVRGGCSPLGAKKEYPVYIDKSAEAWDVIAISAGIRGQQLLLAPADLRQAVKAALADLSR